MVLTVTAMIAEMELTLITERRQAGIDAAKAKGLYKCGKQQTDYDEVKRLVDSGLSKAEVARSCQITRETAYQILKAALIGIRCSSNGLAAARDRE